MTNYVPFVGQLV